MEVDDLSAIPWQLIVGFLCFLLALLFWYVWPKTKAKPYSKRLSWPGFVLHYFHPLAWLLFGMAAFYMERLPMLSAILALLGATAYAIFVVILVKA
jgi:hypothetical protein